MCLNIRAIQRLCFLLELVFLGYLHFCYTDYHSALSHFEWLAQIVTVKDLEFLNIEFPRLSRHPHPHLQPFFSFFLPKTVTMAAVPPAAVPLRPIENVFGILHDTLIKFMVREGTHEALHALVDLERGAIGLHTMGVIRTGMTAAVIALAQSLYIPNYHPNHAAMLAVPGGPVALPGPGPASPA